MKECRITKQQTLQTIQINFKPCCFFVRGQKITVSTWPGMQWNDCYKHMTFMETQLHFCKIVNERVHILIEMFH